MKPHENITDSHLIKSRMSFSRMIYEYNTVSKRFDQETIILLLIKVSLQKTGVRVITGFKRPGLGVSDQGGRQQTIAPPGQSRPQLPDCKKCEKKHNRTYGGLEIRCFICGQAGHYSVNYARAKVTCNAPKSGVMDLVATAEILN